MAKTNDMKFRTPYSNRPPASAGAVNFGDEVSRTKQEFVLECDINRIMSRYKKTGELPPGIGIGRYGDFSQAVEYQEAQNLMIRAREQFAALPATVRDRFKNDPIEFLAFVHDKKNYDEALSLGLLTEEAVLKDKANKAKTAVPVPEK